MSEFCEHETFKDICGICHRDTQITALRAEVERLRAALKAISEVKQNWGSESEEMYELARAALEGK